MDKPNTFRSSNFYMSAGDVLHMIIRDETGTAVSMELYSVSDTVNPEDIGYGELTDYDGNVYTTVVIGTQEWIVENLRVTHYADGTAIPEITTAVYNDWFLPSKDEFTEIKNELISYSIGNFTEPTYWTSTEISEYLAWTDGTGDHGNTFKTASIAVRAIRAFTSVTSYSLRDIGPAGGWIFYKDGDNYLEAASSDLSYSAWSNISDQLIGTTGSAIGTGSDNTTAIISQSGHTNSAAKLCSDLSEFGWTNDTNGAYCYYDNDSSNLADYGLLYNGYAVLNTKGLSYFTRDGVEETGWRIPTYADWVTLQDYITAIAGGGKLKEVGTTNWLTPNSGATDLYGFKALPAGMRSPVDGNFYHSTRYGYFISSTEYLADYVFNTLLSYDNILFPIGYVLKSMGCSVRCVKSISTLVTVTITVDATPGFEISNPVGYAVVGESTVRVTFMCDAFPVVGGGGFTMLIEDADGNDLFYIDGSVSGAMTAEEGVFFDSNLMSGYETGIPLSRAIVNGDVLTVKCSGSWA